MRRERKAQTGVHVGDGRKARGPPHIARRGKHVKTGLAALASSIGVGRHAKQHGMQDMHVKHVCCKRVAAIMSRSRSTVLPHIVDAPVSLGHPICIFSSRAQRWHRLHPSRYTTATYRIAAPKLNLPPRTDYSSRPESAHYHHMAH